MKFLSKKDLKDKLQIILQISHALHVIHKAGFIHRDIKPENVLLDSATGMAKITDLGLAIGYEKVNFENLPVGTLYYMAPEILRGDKFDHRADIYSLGVLSLYIFTEKLHFNVDEPIEILKWHLSKKQIQDPNLYYGALIEMKNKNFIESELILIRFLNSEDAKQSDEFFENFNFFSQIKLCSRRSKEFQSN